MEARAMDQDTREDFWKAFEKSPFIMIRLEGSTGHAEPMTAQLDRDAHHTIWFYARRDNRIAAGGSAMAQFSGKDHEVFACLMGRLEEETDPAIIDKHWSNMVDAWFPDGGRDDPAMIMLRYAIEDAEVWIQDISLTGRFKMLTGGSIRSDEAGRHQTGRV